MGTAIPAITDRALVFENEDCRIYSKVVLGISCTALFIIGSIAAAGACSSAIAGGLTIGVAGISGLALTPFVFRDGYNTPGYKTPGHKMRVASMILLVPSLMIIGGLGCGGVLSAARFGGCILSVGSIIASQFVLSFYFDTP